MPPRKKKAVATLHVERITVVPLSPDGVADVAKAMSWNLTPPHNVVIITQDKETKRMPKTPHIEYFQANGGWGWKLMSSRNDEMVVSDEVFSTKGSATRDAKQTKAAFAIAEP